jgi:DNA-binding Xre family transcriptional regulator
MTRAKKIIKIMSLLNLSNRDMARYLGVAEQTLHYILTGKVTTIKDTMIDKLGELNPPRIIKYLFDLDGFKVPFMSIQAIDKAKSIIRKATK